MTKRQQYPLIPVLNAEQASQWDTASIDAGIPSRLLMESAGRAAAYVIGEWYSDLMQEGVLIAAGNGNNGGDGWVVARALAQAGVPVFVVENDGDRTPDCEANRSLAKTANVTVLESKNAFPKVGLVVDAMLGTGAKGEPRGEIGTLARAISDMGVPVVALDGPTGLDLSTGAVHGPIIADLTITFGGFRRGHLLSREVSGVVVVVDIGFVDPMPEWPVFIDGKWARNHAPAFSPTLHKGSRGKVLVIGGQEGMAGAVMHAAQGAFAAGAGLVKVAAEPGTVNALQESLPDAMTLVTGLSNTPEDSLLEAWEWADSVVIGPGIGRDISRAVFVQRLLEQDSDVSLVLDADILYFPDVIFSGKQNRVATPHRGEFQAAFPSHHELLTSDPFQACKEASDSVGHTVLLKGVPTIVAGDGSVNVVAAGNPSLATGGSGDVLAGIVSALLAQKLPPPVAAPLGAFVAGTAADILAKTKSVKTIRPADVLGCVDQVWRELDSFTYASPPVLAELEPPETR
ncbi:MAG: NAD(P)H-hydrate dehydratase [Gemmatimonadota bacterium]|nr:NAD(P)H-hydrate dehydratase [Gemmatimonadota bacterium]